MSAPSPPLKRKRMSHACTPCRTRKVKCDESLPKCSNCLRLGDECVTIDPRRPSAKAVRACTHRPSPQSLPSPRTQDGVSESSGQAQQQSGDLLPVLPRFICGPKHILTQWLDLAVIRLGISGRFGLPHDSGSDLSSREALPGLFDAPGPCLPPVPIQDLAAGVSLFRETVGLVLGLPLSDAYERGAVPATYTQQLACHLAYTAAAIVQSGSVSGQFSSIMQAALASVGSLMVTPSLDSVAVLALLAMLYRCGDQPQAAWHMVTAGLAVSQSLGIHRLDRRREEAANAQSSAAWCAIYSLEKAICLEQERPSTVRDDECDQVEPPGASAMTLAALRLARIQSRISERLLKSRRVEETTSGDINGAIELKIQAIQDSEEQLVQWSNLLPEHLRPSRHSHSNQEGLTGKTYLSVQFHQTRFLLHRHALILSRNHSQTAMQRPQEPPLLSRGISEGYQTALNDCRDTINVLAHAEENGACSVLDTTHAPLLAIYGLAVHLVKRPDSRRAAIDLELHKLATEMAISRQGRVSATGITFTNIVPASSRLRDLHSTMKSFVSKHKPAPSYDPGQNGMESLSSRGPEMTGPAAPAGPPFDTGYFTPGDTATLSTLQSVNENMATYPGLDAGLDFTGGQQASNDPFNAFGENFFDDGFVANTTDWEFLAEIVGLPSM